MDPSQAVAVRPRTASRPGRPSRLGSPSTPTAQLTGSAAGCHPQPTGPRREAEEPEQLGAQLTAPVQPPPQGFHHRLVLCSPGAWAVYTAASVCWAGVPRCWSRSRWKNPPLVLHEAVGAALQADAVVLVAVPQPGLGDAPAGLHLTQQPLQLEAVVAVQPTTEAGHDSAEQHGRGLATAMGGEVELTDRHPPRGGDRPGEEASTSATTTPKG